jgi:hypothetical protein
MVLLPVANMQQMAAAAGADPEDYSALVAAGREAVLAVLAEAGVGDVKGSIQRELLIDPPQWKSRWGGTGWGPVSAVLPGRVLLYCALSSGNNNAVAVSCVDIGS